MLYANRCCVLFYFTFICNGDINVYSTGSLCNKKSSIKSRNWLTCSLTWFSPDRPVIYAADGERKRDFTGWCECLWGIHPSIHPSTPLTVDRNNQKHVLNLCFVRSCCRHCCRLWWPATGSSTSPESSKTWTRHQNWKPSRFISAQMWFSPNSIGKGNGIVIRCDRKHWLITQKFQKSPRL